MKHLQLLFFIFLSINIYACKCDTPTIQSSFESADFVFIGDIYDVNATYKTGYWNVENALSKVKIEKLYKSSADDFRSKEVTFFGQQFNSCDIIFTNKGKYLIFAYVEPDTTFFYSSHCLATKSVNQLSSSDYELLEKLSSEYKKSIAESNNIRENFSVELKTPDKIINELKFEKQELLDKNKKLNIYLIIVLSLTIILIILLVIKFKRKNCR